MNCDTVQKVAKDNNLGMVHFADKIALNTGREFMVGYVVDSNGHRELFAKSSPADPWNFYLCNDYRKYADPNDAFKPAATAPPEKGPYDDVTVKRGDFDTLVISATRYAMGRQSYIVSETAELIRAHKGSLSAASLKLIASEIDRARDTDLGSEYDARVWRALATFLKGE